MANCPVAKLVQLSGLLIAAALMAVSQAGACEGYKSVPQDQAQKLLDILGNRNAKSIDRVLAFETLACSDMPAVRRAALEEGLKNVSDRILREQILLEVLMQKDSISLELLDGSSLPHIARENIRRTGGSIHYRFFYKNRLEGCISLSSRRECNPRTMIRISGDKIELFDRNNTAQLQLQPDNSLRGFWRRLSNPPISAKINLF